MSAAGRLVSELIGEQEASLGSRDLGSRGELDDIIVDGNRRLLRALGRYLNRPVVRLQALAPDTTLYHC